MSYKQEKIIVIVSEFVNDKREYYPITDIPIEKVRFFYKDDDGLFKAMSSSDYAVRTETNEMRLYITNEKIKNESLKFQVGYEINFSASEYETSLPVLSVLVEMYNTLIEDSRTIFNYVKKQCFISDDKTTSLILPNLPSYTVWCMGENGEMFALPVNELYSKFGEMLNKLKSILADYTESKKEEIRGATFFPHLIEDGTLSWTNDKNKPNPNPVNIKGPAGTITELTATIDDKIGVPRVVVTATGTPDKRGFNLDFKNLKGDKPIKGTDYLTTSEKEQFTNETKAIVQAEGNKVIEQVKAIVTENPATTNALTLSGKTRVEFDNDINKNLISSVNVSKNTMLENSYICEITNRDYVSSTFSGWKSKVTIKETYRAFGVATIIEARNTAINKIRFTVSLNNILINDYTEDIRIEANTKKDVNIYFLKEINLSEGDVLEVSYQCDQFCNAYFGEKINGFTTETFYSINGDMSDKWITSNPETRIIFYAFLQSNIKEINDNIEKVNRLETIPVAFNEKNLFSLCSTREATNFTYQNNLITGTGFYINKTDLLEKGDILGIRLNKFYFSKTYSSKKEVIIEFLDTEFNVFKSFKSELIPNDFDDYELKVNIPKKELLILPNEMILGIRTTIPLKISYNETFKYKTQNEQKHESLKEFYKYCSYYNIGGNRWERTSIGAEYYSCPNVDFCYSLSIETDSSLSDKNLPANSFAVGEAIKKITTKGKNILKLPEKFDLVVGDTFELFYKGIINASNTDIYDITIDCNKNIGQAYKRKYVYTPKASEVGQITVTFNLSDNLGNKLESQEVVFNIINVPTNPSEIKNILCIGDSLTTGGEWVNEFRKRLIGTSSHIPFNITNVNFLGSEELEGSKYEGYGGWTFSSYLTANKNNDFMYINGTFNKTNEDQHSVYKDTNGVQWKLETITPTKIKIIRTKGSGTLPVTGTLTWVSGGQNHSNIVYTSSEQAEGNPFWNTETQSVDFSAYAKKFNVSKIDYVYILLGWNSTGTNTQTYTNQCKQLLDYILKDFPNCKIGLLGLQVPSQNGFGQNYGIDWKYYDKLQHIWKLQEIYQTISKEPQYIGKVDYINISAQFDTEYNMPHTGARVNIRSSQEEYLQYNGVHPANEGYMQIADAVTRNFLTKI